MASRVHERAVDRRCDVPLVGAWLHGYVDEMAEFLDGLLTSTLKANNCLGHALITGTARVATAPVLPGVNDLYVASPTIPRHETSFGLTEAEVVAALAEHDMGDRLDEARDCRGGLTCGDKTSIYSPRSINRMLGGREAFWADTSSDELVSRVVCANPEAMHGLGTLMAGGTLTVDVRERVTLERLLNGPGAVWPPLMAQGYLRVARRVAIDLPALTRKARATSARLRRLELALTNLEVEALFQNLVSPWFASVGDGLVPLARALLSCDQVRVQGELGDVVSRCVLSFDVGTKGSRSSQEVRLACGLALGMRVFLMDSDYEVLSELESGLGWLDVALMPGDPTKAEAACMIAFKVRDAAAGEGNLEETCLEALRQIGERHHDDAIVSRGVDPADIHHFGIALADTLVLVRRGA